MLLALVTVPFVIILVLLIQYRLSVLDAYRSMQNDVRLFGKGLEVLPPLGDVRDLSPALIHIDSQDIREQFDLRRSQADSRLRLFIDGIRASGEPGLVDQAAVLGNTWRDLTVKTGIPIEDVAGPFQNVERFTSRFYNSMSTVLYVSDIPVGQALPNEIMSLAVGSFREASEDVGLIRAVAIYISQRGGYVSDTDARRLENAWQRLDAELPLIDSEIKALVLRTGAIQLQQQWRLVQGELQSYLDWTQNELILAPQVDMPWRTAYQRGGQSLKSLEDLSQTLVDLADRVLEAGYQQALRTSVLIAVGLLLLYMVVLGLALMFYRSNYRVITAKAESDAKGQFLARMSHEIRTPLNGVIGLAELLRETEPTPRQQEYIGLIESAGRTLSALINDVLDFAKIEAGKLQLEQEEFDLVALMVECAHMFNLPASDNGTLILVNVDPATPARVRGDPIRLRQILINLMGNAVKFTPHGRVVLSLSCRRHAGEAPLLTFAVTDTGIGLSAEEKSRLFEQFSQASPSTAKRFGGTGLGLAISRELVMLMGGDIQVRSTLGHGARFSFSIQLPVCEEAVPLMVEPPPDSLVWDVQGTLGDWLADDERFEKARVAHRLQEVADELEKQDCSVLLINGLPEPEFLQEALSFCRVLQPDMPILMLTGMRSEPPAGLPEGIRLIRRSVLTVSELQQLLGSQLPGSIPLVTDTVSSERLDQLRVLVAEDNPVNQMVTRGYLQRLGIRNVDIAEDGRPALAMYRDNSDIGLVLMDLDMPDMDGFTCAREIRALERTSGREPVVILALSAHALPEHSKMIREAGMDGQLIKPLTLSGLQAALKEHLNLRV
ncbi:phosphotransferase-histidine kinase family protein [Alcanivorax hongdengensis A-11-3]|uniref:histidine kinase n=1 Tax=Alcanivorax hongdengensis A-11-3 TaxID=1177179 RepID=L0WHI8_9GAMM|nr:phosphotransferase-histidine kinase family protein [Alcanivorax hongdengensis A-11-3]